MSNSLIDEMSREEKLMLLQVILYDMRGAFPSGWADRRINRARELAEELGLQQHLDHIARLEEDSDFDGRHFRTSFERGGYEGMAELHGLTETINDKSLAFQRNVRAFLEYPESKFKDWREL